MKADWDFQSADYNWHSVEEHLNFQYREKSDPSLRAKMQTSDDRLLARPSLAWRRRMSRSCTSLSATCDVAQMYIKPWVRSEVMSASSRSCPSLPSIPRPSELHEKSLHKTPQCVLWKIECVVDQMRHPQGKRINKSKVTIAEQNTLLGKEWMVAWGLVYLFTF